MVKHEEHKLNLRVLSGLKHFKVGPARELQFDGPSNTAVHKCISLQNKCSTKVAYLMEVSCPEKLMVTPVVGIAEPGSVTEVAITTIPNAGDGDLSAESYIKMYSVVAMKHRNISRITKQWIMEQPHNTIQEIWKCKYNQSGDEATELPEPPPMPRCQSAQMERTKQMIRLRSDNDKLRDLVQGHTIALRTGPFMDGLAVLFGTAISVQQIFTTTMLFLTIGLGIFLIAAIAGKYFF